MDVKEKLKKLAEEVYKQFKEGEKVKLTLRARGTLKTIVYDQEKDLIKLSEAFSIREFFNLRHVRKFVQTLLVASLAKKLVETGKHASLREVYYQLKHAIPIIKENTFDDQSESDSVIEDLERTLGVIREEMHITADRRGFVYGDVTMRDKVEGTEWNCMKLGRGGWAIPSTIEEIEIVDVNADFVLAVETAAMAERLIEEKVPQKLNCIIVATQGQAARGIRRLLHRFRYEWNLPIYVFTDGDPWGYYIYSVIKRGSMKLSYISEKLATPDAKLIGMTMDDIEKYNLWNVTEKLKPIDEKRAKQLMNYPWFKHPKWQEQFKKMLRWKVRIEQQALASKSLDFVAKKYLPEKIENQEFLP